MYTTKIFVISTFFMSSAFCVGGSYQNTPTSTSGQSRMHHMQQKHPDRLSSDQRHVYYMLSPLYQRIFLYGLDDDQRAMVTVFEKRGENPYQAIDNVLRRDRKKADRSFQRDYSPSGRSRRAGEQKKYIISEREKANPEDIEQDTYDDNEYVMHEDETGKNREVQTNYRERDRSDYEDRSSSDCNSCAPHRQEKFNDNNKPAKQQSAFVRRCKAYFTKSKKKEPAKKPAYEGNRNWKKHEYKEVGSKKKSCKCGK